MSWRRKGSRNSSPDKAIIDDARIAIGDLRRLLTAFRVELDELEAEVRRNPYQEEV